jgi:NOL1/NOP2/sun family putative RNA methylase
VKNNLPPEFVKSIDTLLKDDAVKFWQAFSVSSPTIGMRINPDKTELKILKKDFAADYSTLPWDKNGYLYHGAESLGKHPYHAAGMYYLQEPSAMAPVSILDPQPGERVLDLCAAPGGKTTQIHSRMNGEGIIIANDPNPHRVQALGLNIERWGAKNISVLCETPQKLVDHFGEYFDRVLVDAPCSGEGTFRTHPGEIKKWSLNFSKRSAVIQDEILWFAGKLVRPGGFLVYSTCTFNQLENEGTIIRFLEKEPGFNLDHIPQIEGFSPGIPLSGADPVDLTRTVRIWPHLTDGEGHFIARMQKTGNNPLSNPLARTADNSINTEQSTIYKRFFDNNLLLTSRTRVISPGSQELGVFGNRLYRISSGSPALEGLHIKHWGWWLGTFQSDHFIPSSALAAGLKQEDVQIVLEFSIGDTDLASYQRGSPIKIPENDHLPGSWVLVTISSNPLGWGKVQKGRLKSHFPKWLRIN